jgi:hypothetical protein
VNVWGDNIPSEKSAELILIERMTGDRHAVRKTDSRSTKRPHSSGR